MAAAALALALLVGCSGGGGPTEETPPWRADLPGAAEAMGERRGLLPARGIIHLHSVYSHDACDGRPHDPVTGAIDADCLADLRAALCTTRIDFAALTDHDAHMAEEEFETLLLLAPGDEAITDALGRPVAARIACDDGHRVLLSVGGENRVMPLMLDEHPPGTPAERRAVYNAESAEVVDTFRELGALVWIAHTESRSLELLRELSPDGIEIYNLHANIDPNIRADYLGLSASGAITAVAEFADVNNTALEPDLALLSFLEPSAPALERWDELLADGRRVSGSAGTDAHQNALPITLRDGERGDSYRRLLRWFSNVALVGDPSDPAAIKDALGAGRFFVVFEVLGTPAGFDVVAVGGPAGPVELGGEVSADAGATLEVTVPEVFALPAALATPDIRARVLRIDAGGRAEVAAGAGPTLSVPLDRPGAYRVEVLITPWHLEPYFGGLRGAHHAREQVWIYANPIYVTAP
jgi:hypothetical protein